MKCPWCEQTAKNVGWKDIKDKLLKFPMVYRRYECDHCERGFSTYEMEMDIHKDMKADNRAKRTGLSKLEELIKSLKETVDKM